jgi:hypothetical protein
MTTKYQVLTFTIFDGWVNCWLDGGEPWVFASEAEAEAAITEHIAECQEAEARGDMEYAPTREDFRIEEVKP